jgi:hypothetical protein
MGVKPLTSSQKTLIDSGPVLRGAYREAKSGATKTENITLHFFQPMKKGWIIPIRRN